MGPNFGVFWQTGRYIGPNFRIGVSDRFFGGIFWEYRDFSRLFRFSLCSYPGSGSWRFPEFSGHLSLTPANPAVWSHTPLHSPRQNSGG